MGFEEAQDVSTKTFFGFPHGIGVELGFTVRVFALAGSIFTGATGSTDFLDERGYGGKVLFSPQGWWTKLFPTRGQLAYTITYCIFLMLRSTSIDQICSIWELMYDTLYPWKRVGGLRRYARYRTFLTSWQSLKEKAINWHFKNTSLVTNMSFPHNEVTAVSSSSRRGSTKSLDTAPANKPGELFMSRTQLYCTDHVTYDPKSLSRRVLAHHHHGHPSSQ